MQKWKILLFVTSAGFCGTIMPSSAPPNLGEILADVPEFKAQWLALKGSLTYAKSNLTRKLNNELLLAQSSKPCVTSTGP